MSLLVVATGSLHPQSQFSFIPFPIHKSPQFAVSIRDAEHRNTPAKFMLEVPHISSTTPRRNWQLDQDPVCDLIEVALAGKHVDPCRLQDFTIVFDIANK